MRNNKDKNMKNNKNLSTSFFIIEFIKAKKNLSLFIFSITLLFISTLFTFILHLGRVGLSGNQNIPLNYSYGGYSFGFSFYFCLIIYCIFIDSDIREEIKSNKINILFTQSSTKINYYIGKIIFWTSFIFFISILLNLICWGISKNLIFQNRPPRLSNNSAFPISYIYLNLILQLLLLLPSILFFVNLSFISGFFFLSSAAGILFNITIILFSIQFKNLFLYPLNKMFFPSQPLSLPLIIDNKSIIFLIFITIFNFIFYVIIRIFINKREFK